MAIVAFLPLTSLQKAMKVSLFDYDLPQKLIAQSPAPRRDASRLMVLCRGSGEITHTRFSDIGRHLRPGDILVRNDARVIPARVFGLRATLGKVEVLFLEEAGPGTWRALVGSGGRVRPGEKLRLADGAIIARVLDKNEADGVFTLKVLHPDNLLEALESHGHVPVPPYIDRRGPRAALEDIDRCRYQTVYASRPGAVAAPTAGLHFTRELLADLDASGVASATVTLHVGLGTFRPVKSQNVEEHTMHTERYEVPQETADLLNAVRRDKRRLVAVGTTTTRVLESLGDRQVRGHAGSTDIFIYPPYRFKRVDALITNFHLPKSTLLMMVAAFAGRELILEAYREATHEGYRFYSYGDAMLIL